MTETEKIKIAVERTTKALGLKPSLGQSTGISKTTVKNGLTCEIEEGKWKYTVDMPTSVGGNGAGPTPGVLGRGALGSCLAIGYMMTAARMDIPVHSLEVEVHADYDDGALFGTADVFPGYLLVKYVITLESDASEEEIMKMLDEADKHSPYLDVFSRAQDCRREVNIVSVKSN